MRAAPDVPVVSVLAVDHHAAFLRAVRAVVGATSGFEVVAEAQSGEDALDVAARCGPDLVLTDDPALRDASASCGAAVFLAKTRFGCDALASAWGALRPTPRAQP
jgi:DNA-binding NarL/FixJ family response regulator